MIQPVNRSTPAPIKRAPPMRNARPAKLSGALQRTGRRRLRIHIFPPALRPQVRVWAEKCRYPAPNPDSAGGDINMSAHNLMTLFKRTSLIVYDPDIFNCSRQRRVDHFSTVTLRVAVGAAHRESVCLQNHFTGM